MKKCVSYTHLANRTPIVYALTRQFGINLEHFIRNDLQNDFFFTTYIIVGKKCIIVTSHFRT